MNGETRIMETGDFQSTHTPALARSLLGKHLVVGAGIELRRYTVTEVEAYHGPDDRASHASRGLTPRTRVMFGPGGHWYVYLCYGVHEMLNLVTGPEGFPAAILIRGLENVSGPGRLTRQLGLDRRFNARPAVPSTGLYLEDPGIVVRPDEVIASPRIGVDYAGPDWAAKPYRFLLK
jgi:DNA-3-methyladenine glycosylase